MTKYDDHVMEWEAGLPGPEELTPLSQMLITPELAGAFSITPEPCRSLLDVSRASQNTISALRRHNSVPAVTHSMKAFPTFNAGEGRESQGLDGRHPGVNSPGDGRAGGSQPAGGETSDGVIGDKKGRNRESVEEEEESAFGYENSTDEQSARTLKRPRLVWTPQLHKRFVDVVAHLGIKNAVPKTIMQLMNVEGLTRENVASHLQKYRLYLKRMQGLSNESPSPSDQLFASTPVPHNVAASAFLANHREEPMQMPVPMPMHMPFGSPVVPMPGHFHMAGHMNPSAPYAGFDPHAYGTAYGRAFPQRVASADQHDSEGDRVESASSYRRVVPRE